jgi:hypothetical protein
MYFLEIVKVVSISWTVIKTYEYISYYYTVLSAIYLLLKRILILRLYRALIILKVVLSKLKEI